jgi:hypothetical protein
LTSPAAFNAPPIRGETEARGAALSAKNSGDIQHAFRMSS